MPQTFSIREALQFGYQKTKEYFTPLLGVLLLVCALQLVVIFSVKDQKVLEFFAQVFLMPGFTLALISVFFRVADGQKPELIHLSERFHHYLNFVITNILSALAVFVGILLLVVPGIYLGLRLMFATTLVAEKNIAPMEALRLSGILTKGLIWKLLKYNLAVGVINLCGLLLLGVGLFFTVPMTSIATLYIYKKLSLERLALVPKASEQV